MSSCFVLEQVNSKSKPYTQRRFVTGLQSECPGTTSDLGKAMAIDGADHSLEAAMQDAAALRVAGWEHIVVRRVNLDLVSTLEDNQHGLQRKDTGVDIV